MHVRAAGGCGAQGVKVHRGLSMRRTVCMVKHTVCMVKHTVCMVKHTVCMVKRTWEPCLVTVTRCRHCCDDVGMSTRQVDECA